MAKEFGLTIVPDPVPTPGITIAPITSAWRAWACRRSPSARASSIKGHDQRGAEQKANEFVKNDYHHPSDEYHPSMDFAGDAVMARFGLALGWEAATQKTEVRMAARRRVRKAAESQRGAVGQYQCPFVSIRSKLQEP